MLFNSYEFLLVFLPAVVIGYFAIARLSARAANAFLAAASVAFYAWWKLDFVWILAGSIAANYFFGHRLWRDAAAGHAGRGVLVAGIAFNLALLGYFKYADFFISNISAATGLSLPLLRVALPLGVFFGIPATGKDVNIEGTTLVRMENGKIAEERDFYDNLEFSQQLGLIPR